MQRFEGCQLPCVPLFETGPAEITGGSPLNSFKRKLARPWNSFLKVWLKNIYRFSLHSASPPVNIVHARSLSNNPPLESGDLVRVREIEEIKKTLDPFNELRGCSFMPDMEKYCGTKQRVFRSMKYFMDERDYKLKKTKGLILLENVFCSGTPVFGQCDRCCFLFWREEWLERID